MRKRYGMNFVSHIPGPGAIKWHYNLDINQYLISLSPSDLSPGHRQGIFWTNAGILTIGPLGTNTSIKIHTCPFTKMHPNIVSKMTATLSRPQCVKIKGRWIDYTCDIMHTIMYTSILSFRRFLSTIPSKCTLLWASSVSHAMHIDLLGKYWFT